MLFVISKSLVSESKFRYNKKSAVLSDRNIARSSMAEKKYFPELDKLRGIAILMVLLYHSVIVYPVNLLDIHWCRLLHSALWLVEMPIFFLVSGFCFQYHENYGCYIRKKALRLLVPHFVFGVLDMLPRVMESPLVNESYPGVDAFRELLLYASNEWFLWTLFLIFLIAPLLRAVLYKNRAARIGLFTVVLLLSLVHNIVTPLFSLKNASYFLVYFVIGMLLRYRHDYHKDKESCNKNSIAIKKILCAVLCFGIGLWLFYILQWEGWNGFDELWRVKFGRWVQPVIEILTVQFYPAVTLLKLIKALLEMAVVLLWIMALYQLAGLMSDGVVSRILNVCSRYSLQMYLLDGYALVLTRTLLVSICGLQNPAMIIAGNFVADTAIVLLVSKYILDRFLVLRVLSGLLRGNKDK